MSTIEHRQERMDEHKRGHKCTMACVGTHGQQWREQMNEGGHRRMRHVLPRSATPNPRSQNYRRFRIPITYGYCTIAVLVICNVFGYTICIVYSICEARWCICDLDVLLLYIIDEYTLFAIHSVVFGVMLLKWVWPYYACHIYLGILMCTMEYYWTNHATELWALCTAQWQQHSTTEHYELLADDNTYDYSLNGSSHWDAEYNMIILRYDKKCNLIVVGQPYLGEWGTA